MAGLARRLAPAAALGGLAVLIVGVADPALAGRTTSTDTGAQPVAAEAGTVAPDTSADAPSQADAQAQADPQPPADAQAGSAGSCSTEVTGDAAMTPWGPVQVVATTDGSSICEVHAVTWPSGDGKSQMINAYAIPQLDATASASSGTQFDYVSGATYTSNAYAQSLQSILDAL